MRRTSVPAQGWALTGRLVTLERLYCTPRLLVSPASPLTSAICPSHASPCHAMPWCRHLSAWSLCCLSHAIAHLCAPLLHTTSPISRIAAHALHIHQPPRPLSPSTSPPPLPVPVTSGAVQSWSLSDAVGDGCISALHRWPQSAPHPRPQPGSTGTRTGHVRMTQRALQRSAPATSADAAMAHSPQATTRLRSYTYITRNSCELRLLTLGCSLASASSSCANLFHRSHLCTGLCPCADRYSM